MLTAIKTGILYFAVIFTAGAGLGAARANAIEPALGPYLSQLIEFPIILGAAWIVCGFLIKQYAIPAEQRHRIAMAATALALLIAAQLTPVFMAHEITLGGYLMSLISATGILSLLGQVAIAFMPVKKDGVFESARPIEAMPVTEKG